jgi:hypothetical protein
MSSPFVWRVQFQQVEQLSMGGRYGQRAGLYRRGEGLPAVKEAWRERVEHAKGKFFLNFSD